MWLNAGMRTTYNSFAAIAQKNETVWSNARQALNGCKSIFYRFDDFEIVYAEIQRGGIYRSVASLIIS